MVSGEKRSNEQQHILQKITAILLDIEGTTTSVSFVKNVLFPYVKEQIESYINTHWDDPEMKEDYIILKEQAKRDEEAKVEGFCPIQEGEKEKESLIKNVLWQMSLDRKTTALKQLQGHIWREGYKNGKLKGHDVAPAFKKWSEEGLKIYIFSSGSIEAQKLLFSYSEDGDLLQYISGHFDTSIGLKTESSSYNNIIQTLQCEKEQIFFVTDVAKEAHAARSAGIQTALIIREGNVPLTDEERKDFLTISSFQDLMSENSAKRKKMCELSMEDNIEGKTIDKEIIGDVGLANSHINGSEKMEVDIGSEKNKDECVEVNEISINETNKTEEESKVELDDVEIDIITEDKKEEHSLIYNTNGNAAIESIKKYKEIEEVSETHADEGQKNTKDDETEFDSTEQPVEVVPEPNDASDPLDITEEKSNQNMLGSVEEQGDKTTDSCENDDTHYVIGEPISNIEKTNSEEKIKLGIHNNSEFSNNHEEQHSCSKDDHMSDKDGDDNMTLPDSQMDLNNSANVKKSETNEKIPLFIEEKEINSDAACNQKDEDCDVGGQGLTLSKVVSEDKSDPTVEVKA